MFCLLDFKKRKRRIFHGNPPYRAQKVIIPKTAVFEQLTVYDYGKKTDYVSVREHLRAFSKSVVLCNGCVLPAESGIFEFRSSDLKAYMTFNSLEGLLKGFGNKKRLRLVLADKTGAYSHFLDRAALLAGSLTVLSDNALKYRFASDEVYDSTGAVVHILPFDRKMPDCDIFASLSQSGFSPLSICVRNVSEGGFIRLEGATFSLPEPIEKYVPDNVERYSFASALFSLSAVREAGDAAYDTFKVGDRLITFSSAAKMLDTLLKF